MPFGPNIFATFPTDGIISGEAIRRSKEILPEEIDSIKSFSPTKSAPASLASFCLSPLVKTATLTDFPVPLGKLVTPLIPWSVLFESIPKLIATSSV